MFLIYKDDEYFGVYYENYVMAQYVCDIFRKTLNCEFNIKYCPNFALEASSGR